MIHADHSSPIPLKEPELPETRIKISIMRFLSVIKHAVTGILWFTAIHFILYRTGAWDYLCGFDATFRYERNITPLTSISSVGTIIFTYVLSIPIIRWIMKDSKPLNFPTIITIHNLFLLTMSAILAIGIGYFILQDILQNGFFHSICSAETHNNPYLHLFYYINYLLKYYEFVDTYIILLRKRPVIFLHWYHHAITVILTYIQQNDETTVQWVPIFMNLVVHVAMYSYYLLSSWHIQIWWKRYLTLFQIIQFVIDLSVCIYCTWHLGQTPEVCHGTQLAAYSGIGIIGSYFFLFLKFYARSYGKKTKSE